MTHALGIGAHDCEAPLGAVRHRGPHLLPGDDPLVAIEFGPRGDVRQVGACVGLRVALAPHLLDRLDLREEAPLLILAPVSQQRRREQALAEEAHALGCTGLRVLLVEDHLLAEVESPAAVLLGPRHADPTIGAERALPRDPQVVVGLVRRVTAVAEVPELAHEVLSQPRAHFVTKGRLGGRVTEIHRAGGRYLTRRPTG